MNETERRMLRRLHGELSAEGSRQLDQRLADDPRAAETFARLRDAWEGLEGPPLGHRDDALTRRVVAAAEAEVRRGAAHSMFFPRLAASCALLLGTWIGFTLQPTLDPVRSSVAEGVAPQAGSAGVSEPGALDLAILDLGVASGDSAMDLDLGSGDLDDAVLDRLTAEELFATAPTLSESYWLGDSDPVFGDTELPVDPGGTP